MDDIPAKYGVDIIKVGVFAIGHEELSPTRPWPTISHGHRATTVMLMDSHKQPTNTKGREPRDKAQARMIDQALILDPLLLSH